MNVTKVCTGMLLVCGLAASMSTAIAGSKYTGDGHVKINRNADGSGLAVGYLGMVYNGNGLVEYLGCQKSAQDRVFCHARTESEDRVTCTVTSNYLAQSVASMSPDARVIFSFNAKGVCTGISVQHSSEYEDKQG
jgi:hypothetical protein